MRIAISTYGEAVISLHLYSAIAYEGGLIVHIKNERITNVSRYLPQKHRYEQPLLLYSNEILYKTVKEFEEITNTYNIVYGEL